MINFGDGTKVYISEKQKMTGVVHLLKLYFPLKYFLELNWSKVKGGKFKLSLE
jgi:hypothetical protein